MHCLALSVWKSLPKNLSLTKMWNLLKLLTCQQFVSKLMAACFSCQQLVTEVNSLFQLSKQSIPGHYGWLSTTHCWWKKATTEELCRPNALRCLETLHKLTIQGRGNFNMFETAFCIWSCLTTKEHLVAVETLVLLDPGLAEQSSQTADRVQQGEYYAFSFDWNRVNACSKNIFLRRKKLFHLLNNDSALCRNAGSYFKVQMDARSLCQLAALLRNNHTAISVSPF